MSGLDIKELRKKTGLSQKEFAKSIGKSLSIIQKWEKKERFPNRNNIDKILNVYKMYFFEDNLVSENPPKYNLTNSNGHKFSENRDGSFNITAKLMPFDAYATYCETLDDANTIYDKDWEEVTFNVSEYSSGNYMAFKVVNESMNGGNLQDTPSGALVLGKELQQHHWKDGFKKTEYGFVLLTKYNIYHKDIVSLDKLSGNIKLSSRNLDPQHADFIININDVYRIFEVIKRMF